MNKKMILITSFKVIKKTGLEGFTMRELARALNCRPASIYHYYETKNEILNDLYMHIYHMFFDGLNIDDYDLETYLIKLCTKVQQHQEKYLFLIKHNHSKFLSKENIESIRTSKRIDVQKMRDYLNKDDIGVIDYLLMRGPINELAFLEHTKLNEQQIKELVRKMMLYVKGGI